jgi:hypothetical protein
MAGAELWGHIVTSLAKTFLCLVTLFSTLNIPLSPVHVLTHSLAKWCTMCDCLHLTNCSFILSCQRNLTSEIFFNSVTGLDLCGCIISFHVEMVYVIFSLPDKDCKIVKCNSIE